MGTSDPGSQERRQIASCEEPTWKCAGPAVQVWIGPDRLSLQCTTCIDGIVQAWHRHQPETTRRRVRGQFNCQGSEGVHAVSTIAEPRCSRRNRIGLRSRRPCIAEGLTRRRIQRGLHGSVSRILGAGWQAARPGRLQITHCIAIAGSSACAMGNRSAVFHFWKVYHGIDCQSGREHLRGQG